MLAGEPSSGTSLVTTAPTIKLRTGKAPGMETSRGQQQLDEHCGCTLHCVKMENGEKYLFINLLPSPIKLPFWRHLLLFINSFIYLFTYLFIYLFMTAIISLK